MESIGEKLRSTREEKGYSIEQVARDTNIAKRFLVALEVEDFDDFPGEPYLIGFLRNYAEYLGIDPDELVTLYRNFRIQEKPIPMEELIIKKDRRGLYIGLAAAAGVVLVGFIIYLLLPVFASRAEKKPEIESAVEEGSIFVLTDEIVERRFAIGDIIRIPGKQGFSMIHLAGIDDGLLLETPGGEIKLKLGEERVLNLDGNAGDEVKVYLRDIDIRDSSVILRIDKFLKTEATPALASTEEVMAEEAEEEEPIKAPAVGASSVSSRKRETTVITTAESPEPFSINVVFRGYCLVRYLADGRLREERYFHKGETFRLEVDRDVRLWISNAGSFQSRIAGQDISFGRPGEVTTKMINWIQDEENGSYALTVSPVY